MTTSGTRIARVAGVQHIRAGARLPSARPLEPRPLEPRYLQCHSFGACIASPAGIPFTSRPQLSAHADGPSTPAAPRVIMARCRV